METSLTFEEALAALLGLIGEHVDVIIGSAVHGHSLPFADFSGTLQPATELRNLGSRSDECIYFAVGEDHSSGFWLERDRYYGGREASLFDGATLFQGETRISVWRSFMPTGAIEIEDEL